MLTSPVIMRVSDKEIRALCYISGIVITAGIDMKYPSFLNLAMSSPIVLINVSRKQILTVFPTLFPWGRLFEGRYLNGG